MFEQESWAAGIDSYSLLLVHQLFLDESGKIDQSGLFALGGIAVRDSDWPELRQVWQETLSAAGWALDREIKWHGIRKGEVPPSRADATFKALSAAALTAYVTLLDLKLGPEREPNFFRSPEDIYATGLMFLAEAAVDDHQAKVVGVEQVMEALREDDQRLRRFFADLTKDGTPYMQLPRIIEGLFLGPSHYSIGLQCADLIVAMTANAERSRPGSRLLEEAAPALRRASRDRGARGGRPQALPRAGPARARASSAVLIAVQPVPVGSDQPEELLVDRVVLGLGEDEQQEHDEDARIRIPSAIPMMFPA